MLVFNSIIFYYYVKRSGLGNSSGLPVVLTEKYTQTVGSVLGKTALGQTHHNRTKQTADKIQVASPAPLGDFIPFEQIAKDSLKLVEAGDLSDAKTRIKDLETA